jgi:hypothetical protein
MATSLQLVTSKVVLAFLGAGASKLGSHSALQQTIVAKNSIKEHEII